MRNAFDSCPVYETNQFLFRFLAKTDAMELLKCYSDPQALKHMNCDNCSGDFYCKDILAMENTILAWQGAFNAREFVRWSIIQKTTGIALGTIELAPVPYTTPFYKGCHMGILRIDLLATKIGADNYVEIIKMAMDNFFADFQISEIITKAPRGCEEKIAALERLDFTLERTPTFPPFEDYYVAECIKK